jgi:hypothetical protein
MYAFSLICAFAALEYSHNRVAAFLLFAFAVVFIRLLLAKKCR